jgi:hypothetical protein
VPKVIDARACFISIHFFEFVERKFGDEEVGLRRHWEDKMSTILLPDITRSTRVTRREKECSKFRMRLIAARVYFLLCLAFIGTVSAWDAWLVEANAEIQYAEQNPICAFLIAMEPQSKIYFFVAKGLSSTFVVGALLGMYRYGYRYATLIATALAVFQLGLIIHLYLADNLCGGLPNFALLFRETEEQVLAFRFR